MQIRKNAFNNVLFQLDYCWIKRIFTGFHDYRIAFPATPLTTPQNRSRGSQTLLIK